MTAIHSTGVPPALAADLETFRQVLESDGLRQALLFLNRRTAHRYTGVFRFDGDMLRNVALVDNWDHSIEHGDDVPVASAYCAHLLRTGEARHGALRQQEQRHAADHGGGEDPLHAVACRLAATAGALRAPARTRS